MSTRERALVVTDHLVAFTIFRVGLLACQSSEAVAHLVVGNVRPTPWRVVWRPKAADVNWTELGDEPRTGLNLKLPSQFEGAAILSTPADALSEQQRRLRAKLGSVPVELAVAFPARSAIVVGPIQAFEDAGKPSDTIQVGLRYPLKNPNDFSAGGMCATIGLQVGRRVFVPAEAPVTAGPAEFADRFEERFPGVPLQ